jgi:hypothetical protein
LTIKDLHKFKQNMKYIASNSYIIVLISKRHV